MPHQVVLTWNASVDSNVAGYNIYKAVLPAAEGASPINSSPVTGLTYTDTNVSAGQSLEYSVTAVSASGVESSHVQVNTTVPLAPPSNLKAVAS
jgi:fibronectin type 3 domain-containing protein